MKKIKRDEAQYTEIENFCDYELINCICFEMAIRNKNALALYTKFNSELYFQTIFNPLNSSYNLKNINAFDLISKELYNKYYLTPFDTSFFLFFYNFSDLYNIKLYNLYKAELKNIKQNDYDFHETETGIETIERLDSDNVIHTTFKNHAKYKSLDFEEDWCSEVKHEVVSRFKRPELYIPNKYSKHLTLKNLNFNLPLNEIQSYVEHIYKLIEKKNGFSSLWEQFYESINEADNEITIIRPKGKKERIVLETHINNKNKFADLFYIYDAIKLGMKKSEIQIEISYYYSRNEKKNQLIDQKTITKYYAIAKEYIDNLKYKELISGMKI